MRRVAEPPLPTLDELGLHRHARRLGDLLVDHQVDWGPLADTYTYRLDRFAETRRLYCPRCGALLCVDVRASDDERNFRASCADCRWPQERP
jgi:hypothetical protein